MLDKEFADRFIERVTRYTDFNVNIMDDRGIIIASRDKKRIGQYHEVAYRLIRGTEEMIDTTGLSFPNVLPGINMIIAAGGKREGVVGVTGNPEEVRPVALMVKMAFETMLKYEQQLEERRIRENKKDHFIYLLTQVEHSDPEELRSYARDLGYPEESIRIPILLRLNGPDSDETGQALDLLRGGDLHSSRDFSFALDSRHVLVYKTLPAGPGETGGLFAGCKDLVREYLEPLKALGSRRSPKERGGRPGKEAGPYTAFVGSFQDTYPQYYYGYRHCRWLEQNTGFDTGTGDPVFFYDHLNEYLQSMLPVGELQRAFYVYRKNIPDHRLRSCAETIGALIRTNYNFGRAADLLFIHKNTLVYRYKGLKEMLGVDPMASAGDRAFIELFYTYLLRTGGYGERED